MRRLILSAVCQLLLAAAIIVNMVLVIVFVREGQYDKANHFLLWGVAALIIILRDREIS